MLLDILDKETKIKGNLGYKVFELLPDGRLAHIGFPDLIKSIGREYRDSNSKTVGKGIHQYKTGYFIFPSKIDAEAYMDFIRKGSVGSTAVICRVHFNRVITLGAVCFDDKPHVVVVAGAITIIDIEKNSGFKPKGWGKLFRPSDYVNMKK